MATTLSITNASASIGWSFSKDDALGGKTYNSNTVVWRITDTLTNGSGAGMANTMYTAQRTLAGGANESLDLAGSLTNQFGDTVTFTAIKGIMVSLLTTTTSSSITLGTTGSNGWATWLNANTAGVIIRNGYTFALLGQDAAGYAVTAATGDLLKVVNNDSTNTATYQITLYGI